MDGYSENITTLHKYVCFIILATKDKQIKERYKDSDSTLVFLIEGRRNYEVIARSQVRREINFSFILYRLISLMYTAVTYFFLKISFSEK